MTRYPILVAIGVLSMARTAAAWNDFGHMEVAAVAWEKLDAPVRTQVATLLKLNPMYGSWTKGVAAQDRDRTAFLLAATWADAIKDASAGYTDDKAPSVPDPPRKAGYKDRLQHRYWHFIDMPFSPDGTGTKPPAPPNAKTQIAAFRAELSKKDAPSGVRSYDLVWLLHLVGDVHQPLHATARFVATQHGGDHGGNDVLLCSDTACQRPDTLHFHWDGLLGPSHMKIADVVQAAHQLPEADATLAGVTNEAQWIDESFAEAKKDAYAAPVGPTAGPFTLNNAYDTRAHADAKVRVALAGARLARLLNSALK
jgi:hypothetical protein